MYLNDLIWDRQQSGGFEGHLKFIKTLNATMTDDIIKNVKWQMIT